MNKLSERQVMASRQKNRFKAGDWIVHDIYGVGQVKDIVEKGLNDNRKTYYKVTTQKANYWLPLANEETDHIVPIRTRNDFNDALNILETKPEALPKHHKSRKQEIHERWLDGDLDSRARLMRDLNSRLKLDGLNFSEKQMLEKVKRFFITEWLIADKKMTKKTARNSIQEALKISVKKARRHKKQN
jgi:RNA polymerase-interacting CarD/CdnL/TRCF family regulator